MASSPSRVEPRPERLHGMRRRLRAWFAREGRDLPWKGIRDPYRVWISEIMLQQTTVTAVIPYYERFLARFPSVESLAAADEQEVLRLWEGLGYYSRGRNLHRAARIIVQEQGGRFPDEPEQLRQLPGIGRYTAGAIASFAFDRRAPILEANTQRLYARLLGFEGDPRSTEGQRRLWDFAETLLPRKDVGAFNQALMDLGARLCAPVEPDCARCPLSPDCRAFHAGAQHRIPRPKPRPEIMMVHEAAFAIRRDERWLLRQRPAGERWAGLWDFPRLDLTQHPAGTPRESPPAKVAELLQRLEKETGILAEELGVLPPLAYSVTRYRIHAQRIVAEYQAGSCRDTATIRWVAGDDWKSLPLTRFARRFANDLEQPPFAARPDKAPTGKRAEVASRNRPTVR